MRSNGSIIGPANAPTLTSAKGIWDLQTAQRYQGAGKWPSSISLLTNLVAWWTLDETSGTRADSHTNSLDLTDNNTVGYEAGKKSNGASFASANSEYLSRADNELLDFTTEFSISFWLKNVASAFSSYMVIASKGDFTTGAFTIYQVADGENKLRALWNYNDITAISDTPNGTGWGTTWKHGVVAYNGGGAGNSDRVKIWIDGTLQTLSFSGTMPTSLLDRSGDFRLGWNDGQSHLNGSLDEVAVWSRALTQADVDALYNSGSGVTYSEL